MEDGRDGGRNDGRGQGMGDGRDDGRGQGMGDDAKYKARMMRRKLDAARRVLDGEVNGESF